ncbi:hypothetical protein Shyhy01_18820 [Streptomyces hygroscopicus subsp. hygroscopicus]|nr:hypothetical protein [Streptomyces hygroscopicus]GLX48932.1 hypothetical protein Shyhy01_18820 [Streptomyces hygroscopicus subsp. hygroscopicus]
MEGLRLLAKADRILAELAGGRTDRTWDRRMRAHPPRHLLVLGDFAMRRLPAPRPTTSTNSSPSGRAGP